VKQGRFCLTFHFLISLALILTMAITLKEGDKAPAFTAKIRTVKKISLSDYKGKKLVLYFYSEAGSPTCTIESCNLRDNYALLKKKGFEVLG
jgi:peroxiredoxin Q/BCP